MILLCVASVVTRALQVRSHVRNLSTRKHEQWQDQTYILPTECEPLPEMLVSLRSPPVNNANNQSHLRRTR